MKVVVIGANGGGMSFSSKLKRESKDFEIKVFEKTRELSYSACGLPYFIGGEVLDIEELNAKTLDDFKREGIEVLLDREVKEIDFEKKKVYGDSFEESYDKLVIASGSRPIVFDFLDKGYENLFTLKKMEDAIRIREIVENDDIKDVTIVGGGYIGLEMADVLLNLGKNIRIIEGKKSLLSVMDVEITGIIEDYLGDKVEILTDTFLNGVSGDGKIERVLTSKGEFPTDMVILAVGMRPETEFCKELDRLKDGTILVNDKMETSIKDVYAVGDCASKRHMLTGEDVNIMLGTYANRQGKLLGENMAGNDYPMPEILGSNMLRIGKFEVSSTGLNEDMAKKFYNANSVFIKKSRVSGYMGDEWEACKLIYDVETKKILGAQLIGPRGTGVKIGVFALAIERGMTAKELEYGDFPYQPSISTLWDVYQIAAAQVK